MILIRTALKIIKMNIRRSWNTSRKKRTNIKEKNVLLNIKGTSEKEDPFDIRIVYPKIKKLPIIPAKGNNMAMIFTPKGNSVLKKSLR